MNENYDDSPNNADSKSWRHSTTIWSAIVSVMLGILLILLSAVGLVSPEILAIGLAQIAAGVGAIRGRLNATETIASNSKPLR
jgi:hypothetical protein